MAVANFFDRTAQAISQMIHSADSKTLSERLSRVVIAISYDNQALQQKNTDLILATATKLIARLYPRIAIIYTGSRPEGINKRNELMRLAKEINPKINFSKAKEIRAALILGKTEIQAKTEIFVAADSWNIALNINKLTDMEGNYYNPFSAITVACFGVGEIFKAVFAESLTKSRSENFVLSLLTMRNELSKPAKLPPIHIKDCVIVGLGAVGNSLIWSLSKLPKITGSIDLVDPEVVELSNLQRYISTTQKDIGRLKTSVARDLLERRGLKIRSFPTTLGEFIASNRPDGVIDTIAISVDNREDRVAAQALLPRVIFNAWTDTEGRLGSSHHWFNNSNNACLACLYLSTEKSQSETERIADFIGFEHQRAMPLVVQKINLTKALLEEIANLKGYPLELLSRWEGRTLRELFSEGACGGLFLHLNSQERPEMVPLAHQSVLAGALLGLDVIKYSLGVLSPDDPPEIRISASEPPTGYLTFFRSKTTFPKCICSDEDYRIVYQEKYGVS